MSITVSRYVSRRFSTVSDDRSVPSTVARLIAVRNVRNRHCSVRRNERSSSTRPMVSRIVLVSVCISNTHHRCGPRLTFYILLQHYLRNYQRDRSPRVVKFNPGSTVGNSPALKIDQLCIHRSVEIAVPTSRISRYQLGSLRPNWTRHLRHPDQRGERGVPLTNTSEIHKATVGELTIGYIIP